MEIYQKWLILILSIKNIKQDIIIGPRQFKYEVNIWNTKRTNIHKEHLLHNEKERILFLFLTNASFSTHANILWTHANDSTHSKIWPTLFSRLS